MQQFTNVRLTNARGENGGEWFVECEAKHRLEYCRQVLRETIQAEPSAGWRLETRGTYASWHEMTP